MSFLSVDDRVRIAAILSGIYEFTDSGARGRRVLLQQAGLSRLIAGIDLSGSSDVVAADIVGRLEEKGVLRERPEYDALGALLNYLVNLRELSEPDQSFLACVIVRYSLITDRARIDALREKYKISDAPVRPADAGAMAAPPAGSVAANAPPFTPLIPDQNGLERVIHSEDNFLDVVQMAGALYASQAVCRIERPFGEAVGTGFLIGPDLLITNQHVVESKAKLAGTSARFDYYNDIEGVANRGRRFDFDPDFYESSPPEQLDYALLRLKGKPLQAVMETAPDAALIDMVRSGRHRGYLLLAPRAIFADERVNIIQHPDGNPLKAVLTQNRVPTDMSDCRVQYVADTQEGSSGSPVFDRHWNVVALHHSGQPYPANGAETVKRAWKGVFRVNEGIPIRAILKDFDAKGLAGLLPH